MWVSQSSLAGWCWTQNNSAYEIGKSSKDGGQKFETGPQKIVALLMVINIKFSRIVIEINNLPTLSRSALSVKKVTFKVHTNYDLSSGRTKDIGFKVINFVHIMWVQHPPLCCRIQKMEKLNLQDLRVGYLQR